LTLRQHRSTSGSGVYTKCPAPSPRPEIARDATEAIGDVPIVRLNHMGQQCARHDLLLKLEAYREFDKRAVPVPHFGQEWDALAARLKATKARMMDEPHVRLVGKVGEHATMFVLDPSGNALEFKSFDNPEDAFQIDPEEVKREEGARK
jgi:extradiol dioxygenase family protein